MFLMHECVDYALFRISLLHKMRRRHGRHLKSVTQEGKLKKVKLQTLRKQHELCRWRFKKVWEAYKKKDECGTLIYLSALHHQPHENLWRTNQYCQDH